MGRESIFLKTSCFSLSLSESPSSTPSAIGTFSELPISAVIGIAVGCSAATFITGLLLGTLIHKRRSSSVAVCDKTATHEVQAATRPPPESTSHVEINMTDNIAYGMVAANQADDVEVELQENAMYCEINLAMP